MAIGRPPKPAHLKLIEGNPGRRKLKAEPQPKRQASIPEPPAMLTEDAKAEWNRIAEELFNLGLLTVADVQPLAAYCMAYGRWIAAERAIARIAENDRMSSGLMIKTTNGNAIQNPLVGTSNKAASDMVRYAAEFGLTPAARARLAVGPTDQPKSKFSGLLGD